MRVAFLVANEGSSSSSSRTPGGRWGTPARNRRWSRPSPARRRLSNHLDKGDRFQVDMTIDELEPNEFDATTLPGGNGGRGDGWRPALEPRTARGGRSGSVAPAPWPGWALTNSC